MRVTGTDFSWNDAFPQKDMPSLKDTFSNVFAQIGSALDSAKAIMESSTSTATGTQAQ
jgi:hypothetical protein